MNRRDFLLSTTGFTLVPSALLGQETSKPASDAKDVVFADFEDGTYEGWTLTGNCWGEAPASDATFAGKITGFQGKCFLCTLHPRLGNAATGKAVSKEFTIEKPFITFLIGGGNHPGEACLNLVIDGKVVRTETGNNAAELKPASWDVSPFLGRKAKLECVDATRSPERGYIMVDDIRFCVRLETPQQVVVAPVRSRLEGFRIKHHIPGIWVSATYQGKQTISIALGKKWTRGEEAGLDDVLAIGSLSKHFVADLATVAVLKGQLRWDTRLWDIMPQLKGAGLPRCFGATLEQMLAHKGGFPRDHIPWLNMPQDTIACRLWRELQLTTFAGLAPMDTRGYRSPSQGTAPGSETYSNFAYSAVATMIEKSAGKPLETLLDEYLFQPFGLKSVHLGLPNPGAVSAKLPLGHYEQDAEGAWKPFTNWDEGNAECRSMAAAASGGLCMTISDLARYLTLRCNFNSLGGRPYSRTWMSSLWRAEREIDVSSGSIGGYRAWFRMDRKRQLVVVYISNANLTDSQTEEFETYLASL